MESFSLHSDGYDFSSERSVDLIKSVLESGNSVELRATGFSMFPTLRPGDRVVVKPLAKGELPLPGSVVICMHYNVTGKTYNDITPEQHNNITSERLNSYLVLHRLVKIKNDDSGKPLLITRGDSGIESDKPWAQQQLLGVAFSYKRSKRKSLIKIHIPGAYSYKYNRILFWVYNKITKLQKSLIPGP